MPNLSQQKRERMMAFLQKIKDAHRDDDEMLIALGEIESELASKKYGLVWERHEEAVDVMMKDNIPVFTEVPEREIAAAPGQGYNFILEGDNLHSLRLLEKTHKGKIDLIYIDPPYNTGNKDFIYDDAFVDKTDLFSHSKWLSFMDERLRLARNLLSEKGVIFISIDDNEEAPLKMLCDDIFGTDRFVANIAWQRNYSARNDSKGIVREVEHLLVYSHSNDWSPKKLPRTAEMDAKYKNPDNDVAMWRTSDAFAPGAATHQGMVYAIQHPFTGKMLYPSKGACWRYQQETMLEIMCGWCNYELKDINDAKERAAVLNCSPFVRQYGILKNKWGVIFMPKGEPNKRYTPEFKEEVIRTMREERLSYLETARRFGIRHKRVQDWERIYLEEGPEGFRIERRGRGSTGRPRKLPKEVEEDLLAEVQRLRAENEYLKNLQALVLEDERRQRRGRR